MELRLWWETVTYTRGTDPAWRYFPRKKGRIKTEKGHVTKQRNPDGGNHSDNDLKTGWRREYKVRVTWLRKPDFPRCHRPYLGF